ncbi:hypothetical protein [Fructobacillus durionis]|uniref:Uncharacterized protein n=1 Tax=Fructobacillus durionis TaxID=283737 RepID=A0A1I1HN52_9LACO|nr:hypothetical protein [Fructobacillus durionis]SFC25281.1 hypothetical protein SAMN05660453_0057 [Fructobacillus durionis]
MTWYFKYDEATKELVPGAVNADTQPANSTAVDPAGTMFPVYVPSTDSWKSDEVKLAKWNAQIKQQEENKQPDLQAQIADLYARQLQQEMKGL